MTRGMFVYEDVLCMLINVSRVDSYHMHQTGTEHVSITYSKVISRWPS